MNDESAREEQPNRYFDPHFKVDTAKILPGEYYATNKDMALVTVLGSCVSACLRDRETGAYESDIRCIGRHIIKGKIGDIVSDCFAQGPPPAGEGNLLDRLPRDGQ